MGQVVQMATYKAQRAEATTYKRNVWLEWAAALLVVGAWTFAFFAWCLP